MDQDTTGHPGRRVVAWPRRRSIWAVGAAVVLPLLAACGGSTPAPTPVVIVVTVLPPGPETERAMSLGAHHCIEKSDFRSVVELVGALA